MEFRTIASTMADVGSAFTRRVPESRRTKAEF